MEAGGGVKHLICPVLIAISHDTERDIEIYLESIVSELIAVSLGYDNTKSIQKVCIICISYHMIKEILVIWILNWVRKKKKRRETDRSNSTGLVNGMKDDFSSPLFVMMTSRNLSNVVYPMKISLSIHSFLWTNPFSKFACFHKASFIILDVRTAGYLTLESLFDFIAATCL